MLCTQLFTFHRENERENLLLLEGSLPGFALKARLLQGEFAFSPSVHSYY